MSEKTFPRYMKRRAEPGADVLCRCGHRYAIHAGLPESACVRYEKGQRCGCREFVAEYNTGKEPE